MQPSLPLDLPQPADMPADLATLLRDVPPEKLTGRTTAELQTIIEEPLIRAALEKFNARIVDIEMPPALQQAELF